jgi:hypothetical protein
MRRLLLLLLGVGVAVFVAKVVAPDVKRYKEMSDM